MNAAELLRALECTRPRCVCQQSTSRGHGATHCPAHDDEHPSLSVSERDGRVLWACKAGCDQRVVTDAIHKFFPLPEKTAPRGRSRETVFDYGRARHIRLDFPDGTKRMWWEPGGTRMADLPLWNGDLLDESRFDGEPVLLVEGEKDANRGVAFGFLCVSLPGGASQRDFGKALDPLQGRDVVLIPDQDEQGRLLMKYVAARLVRVGARSVCVLELPPASHDLSDFLDAAADDDPRGARADLKARIEGLEPI